MEKLDVNDFSFAHLTKILLLHYLVKCQSQKLVAYFLRQGVYSTLWEKRERQNMWSEEGLAILGTGSLWCPPPKL